MRNSYQLFLLVPGLLASRGTITVEEGGSSASHVGLQQRNDPGSQDLELEQRMGKPENEKCKAMDIKVIPHFVAIVRERRGEVPWSVLVIVPAASSCGEATIPVDKRLEPKRGKAEIESSPPKRTPPQC